MALSLDSTNTRGRGRRRGRSRRALSEINVTPLVDVMLVLLIIFMVTAPLLTTGVPVNLPDSRAKALERPLELHLVAYDFFFRKDPNLGESVEEMRPYYDSFDAVQLWTWQAKDIARQPETLAALRRFAPDKKIYLGLYMWDFGTKREMTADEMKMQLDFALEKWKSREIEGVVFFVTAICNRDFPAVKLAREWAWKNAGCRR